MLSSYLEMSGVELANHDRFLAYARAGLTAGIPPTVDCGCTALIPSFADPGPYATPAADSAPWYDPARPESGHFAGVFIERIEGMSNPYVDRTVSQGIDGGSLGGLFLGPRTLTFRANLFGISQLGLDYGLAWLTSLLAGNFCNASTYQNLGDLTFFAACPDAAQGVECAGSGVAVIDETTLDLSRTMFSGGLVSNPRVVDRMLRGREVVGYEVVWTMAMESPYMAGTPVLFLDAVDPAANAAVAAESWTCPEFVDPCADLPVTTASRQACVSFVEDTCDWDDGFNPGPNSWDTGITWSPTGEEALSEGPPCGTSLTRTGDAGIDGCQRPSVRCLFGDAVGGEGPLSIQFEITEAQGNLFATLWDPATDTNIPVASVQSPSGGSRSVLAAPTGDTVNVGSTLGQFTINYNLPAGVDPGTLYLIFHAFGGNIGGLGGTPTDETITNIVMNYVKDSGGGAPCCNLDPGRPITTAPYAIPCYTAPASTHRQVVSVTNAALTTERGLFFEVVNNDASDPIANLRIAVYDPTLIGQLPTAVPTTGGTWPGGVEEWECNALIADLFIPELPALTTVQIDGRRRQILRFVNGAPGSAVSGDRLVYGGPDKPWTWQTVPPCTNYAVVVFADSGGTPAGCEVTVSAADLHLVSGVAA
jgi:hypothetical protein